MAGQAEAPTPTGNAEEQGLNLRLPSQQTLSSSMELESTVVQLSSVQLSPNPTR